MPVNLPLYLTYDDVLLKPLKSRIKHRADVDTSTKLTKNISLQLPFISANMDTVTESDMAIAMARAGGIGIIHRFMSIEDQVAQIDKVTRMEAFIIENPYTVRSDKTIRHMTDKIDMDEISSFLVVDDSNKLLGVVTRRDILFETDLEKPISTVMTPRKNLITVKDDITKKKAKAVFAKHKIEKLPIVSKDNKLLGLITARSIYQESYYPQATVDRQGRLMCGAAVGVVGDYLERAGALVAANVDAIVVDVAHGQNTVSVSAIKKLRKKYPTTNIIGGNVATASGVRDLIKAGVDAIKVGIGPGGICSTRTVTGVGVPQLSAIMECTQAAKGSNVNIIADGGTNYSGDITKALAAGASTVMLAGWFAGTKESPGEIISRKNRRFKIHRGSASFMSQVDAGIRTQNGGKKLNLIVPEGVESLIEYKGSVRETIYQLLGGLRSGMSYCNARTISELQKNARFIRITNAGYRESLTHNINEI